MQAAEYDALRSLEDGYWWYAGLRRIAVPLLKNSLPAGQPPTILDVGCGTGGMLAHLGQVLPQAQLHGTDLHPLAIAHAAARQAGTLTQSSANALPYRDAAFDAVLAMDVYYVREVDDVRALHEAHRVLKPGGLLLMNLPAFELLRGEHDLAVHTRHRYTAPELAQMLHAAGFSVLRLTYWNALLFPLLLARRQLRRPPAGAAPRSDLTPLPAFINACFGALLGVERFLLAHVNLPFGSSVFAVARKINPPRGIG